MKYTHVLWVLGMSVMFGCSSSPPQGNQEGTKETEKASENAASPDVQVAPTDDSKTEKPSGVEKSNSENSRPEGPKANDGPGDGAEEKKGKGMQGLMTGFERPDSIIYDKRYGRYIVSNLGGSEWDRTNGGSLSIIDRRTGEITHKWAAGEQEHVTLNAPRGMALAGLSLLVADGSFLRKFNRKTGAHQGSFEVPGARLLDSVAIGRDGTAYVTDSAWLPEWSPAAGSGIYKLEEGMMRPVVISEDLAHPGGLVVRDGILWTVSTKTGKVTAVDPSGEIVKSIDVKGFGLRGLAVDSDGDLLLGSTRNGKVLKGPPEGPFKVLLTASGGVGGIGYDNKRNRIVLPVTQKNHVEIPNLP